MNNTLGIILTGGNENSMKELSVKRSTSAMPIGGKYRAIDFTLSNMVNSGIVSIGVITQYNFRSLVDHLGSGKEWDLDRKNKGLFIFPPYLSSGETGWYKGSADAIYNNLSFLRRSDEEYVLIAQGNGIYKMQFNDMLEYHIEKGADITVAYKEISDYSSEELSMLGIIGLDEEGRIRDYQEKPLHPSTKNGSMGIYLMKKSLLMSLLEECQAHGNYDFVKDVLIKKVDSLKLFGYKFMGYWRNLSTIQLYYRTNMELLEPEIRRELFFSNGKVYTKVKDEAPAKYNDEAEVSDSIVADGCIIEGTVKNSILFRGVTVKKGAVVENSILMQDSEVNEYSKLTCVILDKNVKVTSGRNLKGEKNWPVIVGKNVIV